MPVRSACVCNNCSRCVRKYITCILSYSLLARLSHVCHISILQDTCMFNVQKSMLQPTSLSFWPFKRVRGRSALDCYLQPFEKSWVSKTNFSDEPLKPLGFIDNFLFLIKPKHLPLRLDSPDLGSWDWFPVALSVSTSKRLSSYK